ncbi:acyl-phosphate glycerol-3-phosphate acyltransferase [Anaerobacterium chartisolvens]|uniref:Glycerol-3-phosphate acyltransferase n=1 Tax=Anaerobacterium chartisolvens TaxID=1297424 RepID=A0A369BHL9_9FIRM|nr:glycerol-3-phosphate 1-O-acyltransferase PlsY [Anaerobacterium chartisolvens]RCX20068.1 acyl-phosphate glycerol-3-phosphate acyltransferase [Anaerobacterium chartisolvens]
MFIVVVKLVIAGVIGYLLGSANSSLIVGKFYGVDVRKHGSGNAGMTNTLRTLGKAAAALVILGDILKGVLACIAGLYIMRGGVTAEIFNRDYLGDMGLMMGGIFSIAGHNWPLYFNFKGGKGILTTLSVALMMAPAMALTLLGVFIIIVALTRYVSLGSIIAAALLPVGSLLLGKGPVFVIFSGILALLAVFQHRENIKRILGGTERKLGEKK